MEAVEAAAGGGKRNESEMRGRSMSMRMRGGGGSASVAGRIGTRCLRPSGLDEWTRSCQGLEHQNEEMIFCMSLCRDHACQRCCSMAIGTIFWSVVAVLEPDLE